LVVFWDLNLEIEVLSVYDTRTDTTPASPRVLYNGGESDIPGYWIWYSRVILIISFWASDK
jgi:hypothetical protein